jgi:hypothetical protein
MAYPVNSGSEVLKRTSLRQLGGVEAQATWWDIDFTSAQVSAQAGHTVTALHIITVISVIICNPVSTGYTFDMGVTPSGSTRIHMIQQQMITGYGTFVWNDKFVLHGGDALSFRVDENSSGDDHDIYISFIDQDWT